MNRTDARSNDSVGMQASAPVIEIFSGIQGEGPRVGTRTLFLRLAGCNRRCRYCDLPETRADRARIESRPGKREFLLHPNPMTGQEILDALARLHGASSHHVDLSITGGEPLLHAPLLQAILPGVSEMGLRRYLETNGTLPEAMKGLIHLTDEVAMDFKLASATGEPSPWDLHEAFLRVASRRIVVAKLVVVATTPDDEILTVAQIIRKVSPASLQLILQPAWNDAVPGVPAARLIEMADLLASQGIPARIIPQIHKILRDL